MTFRGSNKESTYRVKHHVLVQVTVGTKELGRGVCIHTRRQCIQGSTNAEDTQVAETVQVSGGEADRLGFRGRDNSNPLREERRS